MKWPRLELIYDQDLTYDDSEITGFYYCCLKNFEECDFHQNHFQEFSKDWVLQIDSNVMAILLVKTKCLPSLTFGGRPPLKATWQLQSMQMMSLDFQPIHGNLHLIMNLIL